MTFAETKKEIASLLKANFPNVKFSLTKRNYDTLNINYTDGINAKLVNTIVDKFEGKTFGSRG